MAKNNMLKKPGALVEYAQSEVGELLRCATDPLYFIENYCKIVHPSKGIVNFELYDFQREMVKSFFEHQNTIVCASRQVGKSQTSCAFLLWYAIFHEVKTILIVSNKASGAKEMISRISFMYEYLPDFIRPGINDSNWNKMSISFDNGSKIVSEATTENSGRGLSISLCFCDELAHINRGSSGEDNIPTDVAFWTSISPTLSNNGKCIIASTPNGDSNLYAELWRGAEANTNGFNPIFVSWDTVPGRDEAFMKKEVAKIGQSRFDQEYKCVFISNDPLLFNSSFVNNYKVEESPEADARGVTWFTPVVPKKTYIMAVDPATGSGSDYSVIEVYSFPELHQVAEFRSNVMSSPVVYNAMKFILKLLQSKGAENCYWSLENNGVGEGIISLYDADENPVEYGELISDGNKKRLGFTTGKTKTKTCITLKNIFEAGKLKVKSKIVISEMKNYVRKSGSYSARKGSTDDAISAHLILVRMLEEMVNYEDSAHDVLYAEEYVNEMSEDSNQQVVEPLPFISGNSQTMNFFEWFDNFGQ